MARQPHETDEQLRERISKELQQELSEYLKQRETRLRGVIKDYYISDPGPTQAMWITQFYRDKLIDLLVGMASEE